MTSVKQMIGVMCVAVACLGWSVPSALGQNRGQRHSVDVPKPATTLEGIPSVRIDSTEQRTTRRVPWKAEAVENRLDLQARDWQVAHLSSKPGSYVRFTKLNNKISYVEHFDQGLRSATYWAGLRIPLGK